MRDEVSALTRVPRPARIHAIRIHAIRIEYPIQSDTACTDVGQPVHKISKLEEPLVKGGIISSGKNSKLSKAIQRAPHFAVVEATVSVEGNESVLQELSVSSKHGSSQRQCRTCARRQAHQGSKGQEVAVQTGLGQAFRVQGQWDDGTIKISGVSDLEIP